MNFFNFQLMAVFVEILSTMHPCNHLGVKEPLSCEAKQAAKQKRMEEVKAAKEAHEFL